MVRRQTLPALASAVLLMASAVTGDIVSVGYESDFDGYDKLAIFVQESINSNPPDKNFSWSASMNITLQLVTIETLANKTFASSSRQATLTSNVNYTPVVIDFIPLAGGTGQSGQSGTFTVHDFLNIGTFDNNAGSEMYIVALWNSSKLSGTSYSRPFTVTNLTSESAPNSGTPNVLAHIADNPIFSADNTSPAKNETFSATATTVATSSASSVVATVTSEPTTGVTSQPSSSSSSGGLATGAIIGIAVGCGAAGLLVIGGLIWWFIRRRKNNGMSAVPYIDSGSRTQDLMAEKEANGGADAGPHSPYSDDGAAGNGVRHDDEMVAGAAALSTQQHAHSHDRSYTPYLDNPVGAMGSPSTHNASLSQHEDTGSLSNMGSPAPGRSTPHGVSQQYAHLVEDGMTAEEIQRLEDEERQLDAAIENATRH